MIAEIRCDALEPLPNGNYNSVAGRPGDIVMFTCDEGYRLNGDLTRQCNADSLWTGSMPTCESMVKNLKMLFNFNLRNISFISSKRFMGF